jgi:(4S)-4-hydroxy-5-phosphonooxypentane-2,3-dione isomerase
MTAPEYVIVVEFRTLPGHADAFEQAVLGNARRSLADEPGCRQFDVCRRADEDGVFLLYERYDDEAAFQAHLASPHFKAFDRQVGAWVAQKVVQAWTRCGP